jgi:hypothetical protein
VAIDHVVYFDGVFVSDICSMVHRSTIEIDHGNSAQLMSYIAQLAQFEYVVNNGE